MGNSRIFLSYRRDDSATSVWRIADSLEAKFGEDEVLLDVDDIPAGQDFALELLRALRRCDVLLIVIGPAWSTLTDKNGQRRIDDPLDHVRMEIAAGLSRALAIIPVLVGGASMPTENELPKKVRSFHRRQAVEVPPKAVDEGIAKLTDLIQSVLQKADKERESKEKGLGFRNYFEIILPYQLNA